VRGHRPEDSDAAEAAACRRRRRRADVVGLRARTGHEYLGTLGHRVGHEQLQAPDLVAPEAKADQVIPFEPNIHTADRSAEPSHR